MAISLQDLIPPNCCCDGVTFSCEDCADGVTGICWRVRHESWATDVPSLWSSLMIDNTRCGFFKIVDQYECGAESWGPWSFDYMADLTNYPSSGYPLKPVCEGADPVRIVPADDAPLYLAFRVGGSCDVIEIGLWLQPDQFSQAHPWDPLFCDPPTHLKLAPDNWYESPFTIGGWTFTPVTCKTPVPGPTCFRVLAEGVDETINVLGTDLMLDRSLETWEEICTDHYNYIKNCSSVYTINPADPEGLPWDINSFVGALKNADETCVVWWEINADRTEITLHVDWRGPGASTQSTTFAYTADWFTSGRTVGDFTVDPCPACEAYSCFPDCLVVNCGSGPQPNALFATVSSLNGCCVDGSYSFTWNGTSVWYYLKIGDDTLVTCGKIEIWYECNSTTFRRRVKVTDVNGGISDTTENDAGGCSGGDFADSFTVPSTFLAPLCFNEAPFFTDTVTIDVST